VHVFAVPVPGQFPGAAASNAYSVPPAAREKATPFATAGVPPPVGAIHSGAHVFPAAVVEQFADPAALNAYSPEFDVLT
jgi:hypothetical protein